MMLGPARLYENENHVKSPFTIRSPASQPPRSPDVPISGSGFFESVQSFPRCSTGRWGRRRVVFHQSRGVGTKGTDEVGSKLRSPSAEAQLLTAYLLSVQTEVIS